MLQSRMSDAVCRGLLLVLLVLPFELLMLPQQEQERCDQEDQHRDASAKAPHRAGGPALCADASPPPTQGSTPH